MIALRPIIFGFEISTIDLKLIYTESDGARIEVEAKSLKDMRSQNYVRIEIIFSIVAEVKCINLDFYEYNYNDFYIHDEKNIEAYFENSGEKILHPYLGFYEVVDSIYLQENIQKYDFSNKFNLKHYIITGNDGYVELVASRYTVNELK
jgi:hypothetical protein